MPVKSDGQNDEDATCNKAFVRRRKKIVFGVDCAIALVVLLIILLIELDVIPHRHIGFYCKDPKISFPYEGETVSTATLLFSVYLGPLFIMWLAEWASGEGRGAREAVRRSWRRYARYALSLSALLALVQCCKALVAEHRPHFLHTCRPDAARNCTEGAWVRAYRCTNAQARPWALADASRSFPSGHAAAATLAGLFACWNVARGPGVGQPRLARPLAQLVLLLVAGYCAASRVLDARHHWWDVLVGVTLGAAAALHLCLACARTERPERAHQQHASRSTVTLLADTPNKHAASVVL